MQHKKLIIIEFIISSLLWITVMIIVSSVLGNIPVILGVLIAPFCGIIYISTLSYYICINLVSKNHIPFILLQILPLILIGFFFDIMTSLIIAFTLILGIKTLLRAMTAINDSSRDHIKFRVNTIVLPHTKGIIVWLMLLTSVFIYGNTIRTNPNGIVLDESFLNSQIQTWAPVIQDIVPDFDPRMSVGNYVSDQLDIQTELDNLDSRGVNRDAVVQNQINNLSDRFDISINKDTPIIQAFINYINRFIAPWMSGPLWGIIVSLIVFFSFLPFIGVFQLGIRLIINLIKYFSIKYNLVKLNIETVNKETLSF